MSAEGRLEDAELLWAAGRREGALLCALVAVAAASRDSHPDLRDDHKAFVALLKSRHSWTISVEYRGRLYDLDDLFYVWLRCELVHKAVIPVDIRVDYRLSGLSVRAGGAPEQVLLIAPDWFDFLAGVARDALRRDQEVGPVILDLRQPPRLPKR